MQNFFTEIQDKKLQEKDDLGFKKDSLFYQKSQTDLKLETPAMKNNSIFNANFGISKPTLKMTSLELEQMKSPDIPKAPVNSAASSVFPEQDSFISVPIARSSVVANPINNTNDSYLPKSPKFVRRFSTLKPNPVDAARESISVRDKPLKELAPINLLFLPTRKNLIGEGSHSVVFKAQFSYLNNPDIIPCAVKKLHTDIDSNNTGKNEFDILKLLHHDNIITLLSFQQDLESGHHLLVLELCDNENLWSYQQLNPKLITENSFSRWARQLSSAILYLKSKSVIHCDIKSHNILLTSDLEAKISDFGNSILLSKGFDDSNDGLGRGTLPFSAPELLSESFSFSVDVYSFGVVLFTLLSGQLPFPGKSNMTILMGIKKGFFECGMQRECWVYGNGCGVGRDVEYLIRRMVSKVSINRPSCIELFEFWSAK